MPHAIRTGFLPLLALALTTTAHAQTAPPAGGELFAFTSTTGATINQVTVVQETNRFRATFNPRPSSSTGTSFPSIYFPVGTGGWNLNAYGGIQIQVGNPGTKAATLNMRADNSSSATQTQSITVAPGETRTLKLTFGTGAHGMTHSPIAPSPITALQVFMNKPYSTNPPGEATTLLLSGLRAWGTAADRGPYYNQPSDRTTPVTPPAWLGNQPPVAGNWVQTLDENFTGTGLDTSKWSLRHGWGNGLIEGQTQRYTEDNLEFTGSTLKMRTERNPGHQYDDPTLPTREYDTGSIDSYNRWTQLYGYFEARVKLPTARGLWPAFWMMPDRGAQFSANGYEREDTKNGGMEIDIMEHLTEWGAGKMNVATHWDGYGATHKSAGTEAIYYGPTPDGWHTFGALWEPGKITWYVDGVKKAEWADERVGSVPCYLLLNVQTGAWATTNVDLTKLPDYYEIDYVRAWQLAGQAQPPCVWLTATPSSDWSGVSGNNYPSGRATTLRVASTDKDGTVSKIEFFDNGVKIGEDLDRTRDVFHFYVTAPTDGTHVYQAKAIDNAGNATLSTPVTIVYGTITNPTVSLTAPTNGARSPLGTTLNLTATASDANGISKVEFYDDDVKIGEDTTSPYTFAYTNPASGPHNLRAKAFDTQNNSTLSGPTTVTVTIPPSVSLTSPTANQTFTAGASINLAATAYDPDDTVTKVEFFQGTIKLGEDLTAPYTFTWASAPSGTYSLTARATDGDNNVKTSTAVPITVGSGTTGTGLKAQYYNGTAFNTLVKTQVDQYVYFNWTSNSPGTSIGADNFSIRWTGKVQPRYSETYTFNTITNDGVRLWVNNVLLIDKWVTQEPAVQNAGTMTLVAGQQYDIKMEFYEGTGNAEAKLIWTSPSQAREFIPKSQLYPAP